MIKNLPQKKENKAIDIDASNQKLGRVASEAARMLMGKDKVTFVRNATPQRIVRISHVSKMSVSEKKLDTKTYKRFSGYPGGLKITVMKNVVKKKGYAELVRHAVYGMLPNNKLRPRMMKRLIIKE